MSRYQIYNPKVLDLVVLSEEEFTQYEKERREEARQRFLECEDTSWCQPGTAYIVKTHMGCVDETEEIYTECELGYRQRCRIPEGGIPRMTRALKLRGETYMESVRVYRGRLDKITLEDIKPYMGKVHSHKFDEPFTLDKELIHGW